MAHKERHTASKKKGGAVKILLAVVLLLVLAAGAAGVFAYNEIHGNGKPGTEVTAVSYTHLTLPTICSV